MQEGAQHNYLRSLFSKQKHLTLTDVILFGDNNKKIQKSTGAMNPNQKAEKLQSRFYKVYSVQFIEKCNTAHAR
jgi:hypothetical protein